MSSLDRHITSRLFRSPLLRPRLLRTQLPSFLLISAATILLSGCGNFFQCEGKAACPATTTTTGTTGTGSTGSSTTDYAYVANSATSANDLNAYDLGSGTLTALTGSPVALGYSPSSIAVTPANTFLYTATDSVLTADVGYIYGYSIGTGGALSILSSGNPLVSEDVTSIAISPDGDWLFALDTNGLTLEQYSINASTGALAFAQTYGITGATGGTITPSSVKVAPTGDFVVVALGTGGAETFAFNTTTGVAAAATLISPANASTGIYAVAADGNNNLYCAGTAGLQVFSTTTAGIATALSTYPAGNGPDSIVVNSASTYVYVGNETDSTISGFSIGTGAVLTALSGSPYTAPDTVNALAIDSTGGYLIASGYNAASGIQLYTIGSTGALTAGNTAASGTSSLIPGAIAATH